MAQRQSNEKLRLKDHAEINILQTLKMHDDVVVEANQEYSRRQLDVHGNWT